MTNAWGQKSQGKEARSISTVLPYSDTEKSIQQLKLNKKAAGCLKSSTFGYNFQCALEII
jgi:hypothetical protein